MHAEGRRFDSVYLHQKRTKLLERMRKALRVRTKERLGGPEKGG